MSSRWEGVGHAVGTLLIAFGCFVLAGFVLGALESLFWRDASGPWVTVLHVGLSGIVGIAAGGMIRGYLPRQRDLFANSYERFNGWSIDHPTIPIATYALAMGGIWYSGLHQLGASLLYAVLSAGLMWFILRRERRRRGPQPT
jgi:hypothetical protein